MNPAEFHRRAMDVFDRVCDAPHEQREALLEEHCGRDADLRAKVERMLAQDAATGMADLGDSGGAAAQLAAELTSVTPDAEQAPDRIGAYRIVRRIGLGGMGEVYEAQQENPRRRVALKIVRPGLGGPQLVRRLQREAHVLGRLQHPGIGQVYEAGFARIHGGRQPYFAMEFIDGLPLDKFADQRGLCARARLELVARTCDAVHYAHERGVIHRDLKPGNVVVVAEDAEVAGQAIQPLRCAAAPPCGPQLHCAGQPKVLDFGVARLTDADVQMATLQTEVGQLVGTLSYMSPEQVAGRSSAVDRRSDVYALGVILHELLAGKAPHDIRGHTIPEAARIIRDEEPSRLGSLNTLFRGDIETIVAKAMEKDPQRRYQTAADFAADIRRFLQDQPIRARPAGSLYQFRKFARRHKGLVTGAAIAVVTLVAGIAATSWLAFRESAARENADYMAYRASLAAATAALRESDVASAERHLNGAPPALREWLWEHLESRLDESLTSVALSPPVKEYVDRADAELWFWNSDQRISSMLRGNGTFVETYDMGTMQRIGAWKREAQWSAPIAPGDRFLAQDKSDSPTIFDALTGEALPETQILPLVRGQALVGSLPTGALDRLPWDRIRPRPETRGAQRLFISPEGRWLVSNDRRAVDVHSLSAARRDVRLEEHPEGVSRAVFSKDERYVYTSGYNRALVCFDLDDGGRCVWRRDEAHRDAILALALHPDGSVLASGGEDRVLRLWDAATGAPLGQYLGHVENILATAFGESGDVLASASARDLKTWSTTPSDELGRVSQQDGYVASIKLDAERAILLTATAHKVRLWDAPSGAFIADVSVAQAVRDAVLCGDRLVLFTDDELMVRDLYSRNTLWRNDARAVLAAGDALIVQPSDGNARIVELNTGESIGELPEQFIRASASESGARVALLNPNLSEIRVYDIPTRKLVASVPCLEQPHLFLLDDGNTLAIAEVDRSITLVDLTTSRRGSLRGHTARALCIAEIPDSGILVSGGLDRTIRVWDLRRMEEVGELREHRDRVTALVALPDGRSVFSTSNDYTVRRWDTFPQRDLHQMEQRYQEEAARLAPWVARLLNESHDIASVVSGIDTAQELTPREHQIAHQVLLGMAWNGVHPAQ